MAASLSEAGRSFADLLRERGEENVDLYRRYVNPSFADLLGVVGFGRRFVRAGGMDLEDESGDKYLDFLSGYGVHNLGHNHPGVREAIQEMLEVEAPGFTQVECSLSTGLAAEALVQRLPAGLNRVFFCNSGSEAVEAAIKLARVVTRRRGLVSCDGGYHGMTWGAVGLMGEGSRRRRFLLPKSGVSHVPFGDLDALRKALKRRDVAAFVVEPVQGEGGAVVAPRGYLPEAADLCREYRTFLILDEVQTGLGRTGKMFALEHEGVVPDAMTLAKSLGGGWMPVGAMVAREEHFHRAYGSLTTCLDHRTTFGGGPLAMAAVWATFRALEAEGLVENAAIRGQYLKDRLDALRVRHAQIGEVRGQGLLMGLKFTDVFHHIPGLSRLRLPGHTTANLFAQYVSLRLMEEHRIVSQVAANDFSVLKVMPPLMVTEAQIDRFIAALDAILSRGGHGVALLHLAKAFLETG